MNEEERITESSTTSYIWYTAIWYLLQFVIICGLHKVAGRQLDKKLLQKAATDTLLLALVFLTLQWSQRLLSCAIYRLPYVVIHLFMDLIPTALWIGGSQLMLLECLGLAQKLYNHVTANKPSTSTIESHMNMVYFTSISKSQQRLEQDIQKYITKQFPKLTSRLEQNVDGSPALALFFTSASLLLRLSTLGLTFVNASWSAGKTGYQRVTQKRVKDFQGSLYTILSLMLVTIVSAGWIQYNAAASTLSLARRTILQVSARNGSTRNKSMKTNNETSVSEHADSNSIPCGSDESTNQFKQHDE